MPQILWTPSPGPQTAFLASTAREVLYGGAVGGGKSEALVVAPLRWAHHANHRAIIFRRERKNIQETIDRTRALYPEVVPGALWHETELRWKFPSGASIFMAHSEHAPDIEQWKSFEFNQILFDELTEFEESQYVFMLSRNRSKSADLPLQVRSATNPGGVGMGWVMKRFISEKEPYRVYANPIEVEGYDEPLIITRQFIPSTIFDNPHLPNRDAYIAGLADMDEATREAMLYGRWDKFKGQYFPKAPNETNPGVKTDLGEWYVIRCMDYGWSDPTAVLWLVVYPEVPLIEVAAELYSPGLTTDSIASMIHQTETRLRFLPETIRHSVLSPEVFKPKGQSQQSISSMLSERGVWFTKATRDRVSGWAQLLRLIERDQLRVWRAQAPNLMRTITQLPRDEKRPADIKTKGIEDHAPEALRYGSMAYYTDPKAMVATFRAEQTKVVKPALTNDDDRQWDRLMGHLQRGQGVRFGGLGVWS